MGVDVGVGMCVDVWVRCGCVDVCVRCGCVDVDVVVDIGMVLSVDMDVAMGDCGCESTRSHNSTTSTIQGANK